MKKEQRRSDREWLEAVVLENYARVKKAAYRRARSHGIPDAEYWAEDMTQEVFLLLSERMEPDRLREHENITGWLLSVLRNVIGNAWQKSGNQEIPVADVWRHRQQPATELPVEDLFPPGLTDGERELLYLCDVLELPRREVARELDISPAACRMRLWRAERKCRKLMEVRGTSTKSNKFRQEESGIMREGGVQNV